MATGAGAGAGVVRHTFAEERVKCPCFSEGRTLPCPFVALFLSHWFSMSITPSARSVAIDLIGTVLRRKRPLDDAIEDNIDMAALAPRDRAFARLLVATVLRRLGQIDALIAHCL